MWKLIQLMVAVLTITACTPNSGVAPQPEASVTKEIPEGKRVYLLHHRILPQWTYQSKGKYLEELARNDLTRTRSAATEIVSKKYANGIKVEKIKQPDGVLITFPKPKETLNCYYAFITESKGQPQYITYEKTIDLDHQGYIGAAAAWGADGNHYNYGVRKYRSKSAFLVDVANIISGEMPPQAILKLK